MRSPDSNESAVAIAFRISSWTVALVGWIGALGNNIPSLVLNGGAPGCLWQEAVATQQARDGGTCYGAPDSVPCAVDAGT